MKESVKDCIQQLRLGLESLYGSRLRQVMVFGSHARGHDQPDSDIDVLIVLDRVRHYAAEIDATGELISKLSLRIGKAISRVFINEKDWASGESIFLENLRDEAVSA